MSEREDESDVEFFTNLEKLKNGIATPLKSMQMEKGFLAA
jgi:hypothetical protein